MSETIKKHGWILVDNFGQEIEVNEKRQDFRGDIATIENGEPPHKEGSSGMVFTKDTEGNERIVYPTVYGLRWIKA